MTADADMGALAAELRDLGRRGGLDAVGIAGPEPFLHTRRHLEARRAAGQHGGMHFTYSDPVRATDPGLALPGARALLVGALGYDRGPPPPAPQTGPGQLRVARGRVARYSWRDHYASLRAGLGLVAERLAVGGWAARLVVDDNALVDREAAYRAGLGWYGKNTLLMLPGRGSWYVLGSVITDAPLPADPSPVPDGCGSCSRCLAACPTGALVAPGILDARLCLAWRLEAPGTFPVELRAALGGRIYGCDDCQEACPPNRARSRHHPPPPAEADAEPWVDLVWMLGLADGELVEHFARWYIPRRAARYLRRNALVALANVGDGRDPSVGRALALALSDRDPLVRSHAVWAAARLGRGDLLVGLLDDPDPAVRAEVEAAAGSRGAPATA